MTTTTEILLIGADGFLGSRLAAHWGARCVALGRSALNLTRPADVTDALRRIRPRCVVLTAALADTGYCAAHPDESERVNLQGPVNVARACREVGARLVYMSSDQVYNACPVGVPLSEEQAVSPRGPYACHKLQAECAIARELPGAAVSLRLTWMYDDPRSPLRAAAHLLRRLAEARRTGHPLRLAVNDHRGLTDVRHVVELMDLALTLPAGVYNFGCTARLNTYQTVHRALVRALGDDAGAWVKPDAEAFAPAGRNLLMSAAKAEANGICFGDTEENLVKALAVCPDFAGC